MRFRNFAYMHSDRGLGRRIQYASCSGKIDQRRLLSFPLPFPRLFEVGRLIIGVWKMRGGCLVFVGDVDRSSGTICLDNVEM